MNGRIVREVNLISKEIIRNEAHVYIKVARAYTELHRRTR